MIDFIREWIDKNRQREDERAKELFMEERLVEATRAFEEMVMNDYLGRLNER